MSCEIVTGKKIVTVTSTVNGEDKPSSLLFDQNSTKRVSHFIHIEPCQAFQIYTFGLPDGAYLTVHRAFVGGGDMPQGSGCLCGVEPGQMVSALATEPFKIDCKPVVVDNCTNVLFLTVPGTYLFELNSDEHLGKFLAFAEAIECCCLPTGLIIGNAKPDGYVGVARG